MAGTERGACRVIASGTVWPDAGDRSANQVALSETIRPGSENESDAPVLPSARSRTHRRPRRASISEREADSPSPLVPLFGTVVATPPLSASMLSGKPGPSSADREMKGVLTGRFDLYLDRQSR